MGWVGVGVDGGWGVTGGGGSDPYGMSCDKVF